MEQVRLGLIGSGFMAHTYAEVATRRATGVRLVAVAGGRRAPDLAARYGVIVAPSVEALLASDDIDAVVLAAPETTRLAQTERAAAAGKHVMSEKPMATTVADCDAMIAACQRVGVVLSVAQTQRYRGVHQRAKALIDEGAIGAVRQLRLWSLLPEGWTLPVVRERPWYADPDAGIFLSQNVHTFDLLRWLAGAEARRVYASVGSHGGHGVPNLSAAAIVEFTSGATGQLWTSMELPDPSFPVSQFHSQVVGERGLLDLDGYSHLDLAVDGAWRRVWEQPPLDPMDPLDPVRLVSFTGQLQGFIDAIRTGQTPAITGADGRAAVALCLAALRSAREGQPVELAP